MFARTRFSRRSLSGLADKWSQAHAGDKLERRRWPRPGSPLASYIKHDIYSDEEEAAMVEAASRSRLPPLTDEAESFEAYVEHVQTNNLARQTSSTAAQIRNEAQHYRLTAGGDRSMPQASAFIDEPSWEDVGDGNGEENGRQQQLQHQHQQRTRNDGLPAGRFSDHPRQSASGAAAAAAEEPDKAAGGLRASIARFSLTPRAVKAHLDEYVIGQDQAKRALSVAVCDHYNFARTCLASPDLAPSHHVKPNILLLGPSGSGKTHLMRALSKLLCVPFVKADATKFSATGYVGGDVDDVVRSLLPAAGGDVEMAEFGIVYIDEVDKLAESAARRGGGLFGGGGGSGINTRDVQHALLKLMEDAEVPLQPPNASAPSPPPHLQRGGQVSFRRQGCGERRHARGASECPSHAPRALCLQRRVHGPGSIPQVAAAAAAAGGGSHRPRRRRNGESAAGVGGGKPRRVAACAHCRPRGCGARARVRRTRASARRVPPPVG